MGILLFPPSIWIYFPPSLAGFSLPSGLQTEQDSLFSTPLSPAQFSLPRFYFLLPTCPRLCYWKLDHWDEGWAAATVGAAEKGLKYRLLAWFWVFFFPIKCTKLTFGNCVRKGRLSGGSTRIKSGFSCGLYSAVKI